MIKKIILPIMLAICSIQMNASPLTDEEKEIFSILFSGLGADKSLPLSVHLDFEIVAPKPPEPKEDLPNGPNDLEKQIDEEHKDDKHIPLKPEYLLLSETGKINRDAYYTGTNKRRFIYGQYQGSRDFSVAINRMHDQVDQKSNPAEKEARHAMIQVSALAQGISLDLPEGDSDKQRLKDFATSLAMKALDFATDVTPVVSLIKDITTLATGVNPVTNDSLEAGTKVIILASLLVPAIFKVSAKAAVGLIKKVSKNFSKSGFSGLTKAADKAESLAVNIQNGKGIFGNYPKISKNKLNSEQLKNLKRFEKKIPAGSKETTFHQIESGVIFNVVVPGRVPGSKAVYEKMVDATGKTKSYVKTSYDQNGRIIHIKDKIDNSIIIPEK